MAKDLNSFFDKFERNDRNTNTMSSFASKGVSPSKASEKDHKPRNTLNNHPPPPSSAKKRSLSRNNPGTKSFIDPEDDPHAVTVSSQFFPAKSTKVEGH